ncbi:adenosylcobinamide-GDP ribazoletransferase [Dyadobacter sp. CY107]|uniref:adenosylcobinamide-GDP ribazoletransferase n=1 Tax=Dyadobacter fanqingshengii TaxID=2906443 RepID=UPI001F26A07E|nr:adenosylcobinamide-GDP ribazoletransferase [Dyadobacter fanqingshengii]MCF2501896.1 adenosylcobinamide-GDP ribazoletransferase [Dyadobacter fanqingshengii]
MKQQLTLFFTAVQFYTRIPAPRWVLYRPENLSQSTGYLPLIGWLVGIIAGISWLAGAYLTNISISLLLSMIAAIFTTGAFHEDGFADVCDGFGGGWTRDKILEIMKDSRVGTYGSVGLMMMLALKFMLLNNLALQHGNDFKILIFILIAGHAWSRLMPVFIILTQPYARPDQDSKAKPVAYSVSWSSMATSFVFALIPLVTLAWICQTPFILICCILPAMLSILMARYFKRWIGGYTGDCLGAIQQVGEVAFYFSLTALWKFF